MDGIAIGIVCSAKDKVLISSTIVAVIAHEIPQELGDAGIML